MASNKRKRNREDIEKMKAILAEQEIDLIPEDDLARFRALLAQPHRTEDDWTVIKDMLGGHRLLTAKPMHPMENYCDIDCVLLEDDHLMAFTNIEALLEHLHEGQKRRPPEASQVYIGSMGFDDLMILSDDVEKKLLIDYDDKPGRRFLCYFDKSLHAQELKKRDAEQDKEMRRMLANLRLAVEAMKMERFPGDDEDYKDGKDFENGD